MKQDILDHNGKKVTHGKETVNGVRLHYYMAGDGEPLILLHGVPKTSYYWRKALPMLTSKFTVIVPDLRGFGDSTRPNDGYDMRTMAENIVQLASRLGYESFNIAGEDWGAACSYTLAAAYPDKVKKLAFVEMILPGFGLEDWSFLTTENVNSNRWLWHINFYSVPDFPEFLITGRERQYFNKFFKNETYDPNIPDDALDEYVRCYSQPGGLRSMFEVYRATLENGEWNKKAAETKLPMPVLAVGSKHFIADEVQRQMERVATDVSGVILDYGHQLAEECPEDFAHVLDEFFSNN